MRYKLKNLKRCSGVINKDEILYKEPIYCPFIGNCLRYTVPHKTKEFFHSTPFDQEKNNCEEFIQCDIEYNQRFH